MQAIEDFKKDLPGISSVPVVSSAAAEAASAASAAAAAAILFRTGFIDDHFASLKFLAVQCLDCRFRFFF
jgi:hypothetical protein